MRTTFRTALAVLAAVTASTVQAGDTACRLQADPAKVSPAVARARAKATSDQLEIIGEEIAWSFRSPASYLSPGLQVAGEPALLHQDVIKYPGAAYIAPHFASFDLAPGDRVVIRSPDNSRSWTYTGFGKLEKPSPEGFWGIHIAGDTAIVELYSRGGRDGSHAGYVIDRFARGFNPEEMGYGFGGPSVEPQALCGADDSRWAKCYTGSIYNHARPVARLIMNGTSACTGWLVGNQGHVLTNNHCISTSSTAANTDFEFMAEGAACSTSCASWGACPGTIVATSSTLVKTDAPRDYTLVKLPTNPTGSYGYLQLRNTAAVVGERIYVPQHPAAWGKKIAVASTATQDTGGFCKVYSLSRPACQSGGPNDIGYYCDTQGGSSGSPVIAYNDNRVVSLHHCANCPNRGVPITSVITHLGSLLPTCALRTTSCPDPNP